MPLCVHNLGQGVNPAKDLLLRTWPMRAIYGGVPSMMSLGAFISGGVLDHFPRLRLAFLEVGSGWAPYIVERMQESFEFFGGAWPDLALSPLEYARSGRVYFGAEPDEDALPAILAYIGADHVVFGSDYCHPEGKAPETARILLARPDLSADEKRRILSENPARLYQLMPD